MSNFNRLTKHPDTGEWRKELLPKKCKICRRELDIPGDPSTSDCGGDCAHCVAKIAAGGKATNTQVGGDHYKSMKIQPVEFIHANGLSFLEGNVVKYIARHRAKNGKADVEKALHYCQLLLELEYGE